MNPADFQAWRQHMGMSQRAAAQALGVSLPTLQAWERGASFQTGKLVEIDRRTALACAALAAGIGEWAAIAEAQPHRTA
ncbi:helix-turn-helix domain-containing protein [Castellaniella sp.]|uniref:helix-turn-helix domain-containing protein n=1 Tax=Castellaniella sp. TaxID=1955812 RepID=UPI003A4C5BEC